MNMPGFTAEESLYRMKGEYAGFSTRASRPGTSSVMAQLYIDYWAVAAEALAVWLGAAVVAALAPVRLSPRARPPARAPAATAVPTSGRTIAMRFSSACCSRPRPRESRGAGRVARRDQ